MSALALDPQRSVSPTWRRLKDALRRHPTAIVGALVLMIMILIFSATYVLINLAVDLSYMLFDPRIRY